MSARNILRYILGTDTVCAVASVIFLAIAMLVMSAGYIFETVIYLAVAVIVFLYAPRKHPHG